MNNYVLIQDLGPGVEFKMIKHEANCQLNVGNFSFSQKRRVCPECNSTRIVKDYSRGEITCDDCGLVISDNFIETTEKGLSSRELNEGRPSESPFHHDMGLSTIISHENKDINGRDLKPEKISEIIRLRKWDKRARVSSSRDRNLIIALNEITRIGASLDIPKNVIKSASFIYRKSLTKNLVLGRSIECMCRACLYIACRQAKHPKCLDEMIFSSDYLEKKEISKAYRLILRELNIKASLMGPCDYLPKISTALALPSNVTITTNKILKSCIEAGLTSGRNPLGLCAAAIYLASQMENHQIKQKDIALASNVTDMTLRKRYRELVEKLQIQIN